MNPKFLYLSIDVLTISIPLIASFYPKAPFYKKWKFLWIALLIPGIIFLVWDELFTQLGVWGFNEQYLTGMYLGSLPIEEVLFFICIPYSCIFIYFSLEYLVKGDPLYFQQDLISSALAAFLLIVGACNMDKLYTSTTFLLTGGLIAIHLLKFRSRFLGKFYLSFAVVLIPFVIVNGILTGSFIENEVVWYNDHENLGIRIGTIPVEDVFYGMLLLLLNITVFEWMQQRVTVPKTRKVTFRA